MRGPQRKLGLRGGLKVAYLGPAGTHSEEALRASAPPEAEELPYPTIYDAVMAVHDGTVDTAIVPIENALEGSVAVTLDTLALEVEDVRIAAEIVHPIHHFAIAAVELSLSRVERVVSHPQATAQCARFLREHVPGAEHVSAPSTAEAVLSVCESADSRSVALGSRLAAELYDCHVVAENVEDHPDNLTRIESRPRRTGLGHYMFFAELEGAAGAAPVSEGLDALAGHVQELRVLGSYGRPLWLN